MQIVAVSGPSWPISTPDLGLTDFATSNFPCSGPYWPTAPVQRGSRGTDANGGEYERYGSFPNATVRVCRIPDTAERQKIVRQYK